MEADTPYCEDVRERLEISASASEMCGRWLLADYDASPAGGNPSKVSSLVLLAVSARFEPTFSGIGTEILHDSSVPMKQPMPKGRYIKPASSCV